MQMVPNWHDARALQLIDACVEKNSFPRDVVQQITAALAAAKQHNQTAASRERNRTLLAALGASA